MIAAASKPHPAPAAVPSASESPVSSFLIALFPTTATSDSSASSFPATASCPAASSFSAAPSCPTASFPSSAASRTHRHNCVTTRQ